MQIGAVIDRFAGRLPDLEPRRALLISAAVFLVPIVFVLVVPHALEQPVGVDFRLYHEAATRWLSGGSFYEPYSSPVRTTSTPATSCTRPSPCGCSCRSRWRPHQPTPWGSSAGG